MCGIIGSIGDPKTSQILLDGLSKLEYRGYDSAGIFVTDGKETTFEKVAGRIANLRQVLPEQVPGTTGIGHTRWATHGEANSTNAHPHLSQSGRFVLVHNGVINNAEELKNKYLQDVTLKSETDTEVIVQLLDLMSLDSADTFEALTKTLSLLEGSYALGIIDLNNPQQLFAAKNKSPLLIGLGNNANYIASDAMALLEYTNDFIEIMDGEIITLTADKVLIQNMAGDTIERNSYHTDFDASVADKGPYAHYMLKEIEEQPSVIRQITQAYTVDNKLTLPKDLIQAFKDCDRLYIIACGTSYHAGLIGKIWLEKYANLPVEVHIASEFAYYPPVLTEKPLFLFISQSGETADSRQALQQIKENNYPTVVLTNVPNSTLVRETDHHLLLHAGPEIAVASTKAYTAQLAVLAIMAKVIGNATEWNLEHELALIANAMETIINNKAIYQDIVNDYLQAAQNAFFLGRGKDYALALEAALKLKEISYIQAEGYASGELKHGPIALIEKDTPVILLNSEIKTKDHLYSNGIEVASRGAKVVSIATEDCANEETDVILPSVSTELTPLLMILPCQFLAYYTALSRGLDVDKPRNLAKSVTVE